MRKLLIMLGGTLTMVIGQLIGNQLDENGCVSDGGYEWCETTEQCQRPWEIPCKVLSEYCQSSNLQTCRLACDEPICETHNCAMRIGNCCEYVCVDRTIDLAVHECTDTCPPPIPCPMPEMNEGCSYIEPLRDYCGCIKRVAAFSYICTYIFSYPANSRSGGSTDLVWIFCCVGAHLYHFRQI